MCLGYGYSVLVYRQQEVRRIWGRTSWFEKEALPLLSQWQVADRGWALPVGQQDYSTTWRRC